MKRTLVLVAALSTALIACGDDDDDAGAGTTAAAGSTASGGGGEYCTALADFKSSRDEFVAAVASGTATPEQIQTAITNQGSAFTVLIQTAPDDIAEDIGAIADPVISMMDALADVDYDLASLTTENAAAAEALNEVDEPVFFEATERVDAYNLENCGITMGDWLAGLR